ncbi:hypothetical protein HGI47_14445 [Novosphingobium sp. ERN07]|uniref:hypothetical protein n=1 Tax=Novosphingobium sp. ERN07 TaxID=2726187 RepID=UPI0014568429|nr:hypothetical protein [Novosphingobium sp. ERN07]NLR72072.1 hypothetical protein [Novosphingobium sp. ERN07]
MSIFSTWRAGFEIEVILGDLDDPVFERELREHGPMDQASPKFCQAVARALRKETGRSWTAPTTSSPRTGFFVVPEYGLDPLNWPKDRLAGVELLTPPLPLEEAELVRCEIIDAIDTIDGDFNFVSNDCAEECGWHINIDAGTSLRLDPNKFIVGVDELLLLARNNRLFSTYTGIQRHAVGIPLLRHFGQDPNAAFLQGSALSNFLDRCAGRDKGYAANFAKLANGYVELRHFSAQTFFNGRPLEQELERIPSAFEVWFSQEDQLDEAFLRKFRLLAAWLDRNRQAISWDLGGGVVAATGQVLFGDQPIGQLTLNGLTKLELYGRREYEIIAAIRDIQLPDVPEAIALLALDLAELRNLGIRERVSANKDFQSTVVQLAKRLKTMPNLASERQLVTLAAAQRQREEFYDNSIVQAKN